MKHPFPPNHNYPYKHPSDYMNPPPKKGKKWKKIKPIPPSYGFDNFQNFNYLREQMNGVIKGFNDLTDNNERYLHKLWSHTFDHGAYYHRPEVWYETGYNGDEGSHYSVIHKNDRDKKGFPIPMRLHLAYNNHTNSKLKEYADLVSFFEKAQFCIPAYPINDDVGYYGHTIQGRKPIPSTPEPDLYTVGFTENGRMKYYSNKVDISQLRRDHIESATGCLGVLVTGGVVADESLYAGISNRDEKVARIAIGQNYKTKETFIFTAGDYDTHGFTSVGVAEVMVGYGCDVAVEICNGNDAVALYKGKPLFIPSDTKLGANYGYWYCSRKKYYRDVCTHEVADLVQLYGLTWYKAHLNSLAIEDLQGQINNIIIDITNLGNRLTDLEARVEKNEQDIAEINDKIDDLQDQINTINGDISDIKDSLQEAFDKINKEIEDRIAEVKRLDDRIDEEHAHHTAAEQALQALIDKLRLDLDKEVLDRIAGDEALDSKIDQEIADRIAAIQDLQFKINDINARYDELVLTVQNNYNTLNLLITGLRDDVSDLQERQADLESQMNSLDATVTTLINSLADIEVALNNLKSLVIELTSKVEGFDARMTAIETRVEEINVLIQNFSDRLDTIETTVSDLTTLVNSFENRIKNLEEHPFVVTANEPTTPSITAYTGNADADGHIEITPTGYNIGTELEHPGAENMLATELWVMNMIDGFEQSIFEINQKIIDLTLDVVNINETIVNLQTKDDEQDGRLDLLEDNDGKQDDRLDQLENSQADNDSKFTDLTSRVVVLEGDNTTNKTAIAENTANIKINTDNIAALDTRVTDLEAHKALTFTMTLGGGTMGLFNETTGSKLTGLDLSYMRLMRTGNVVTVSGCISIAASPWPVAVDRYAIILNDEGDTPIYDLPDVFKPRYYSTTDSVTTANPPMWVGLGGDATLLDGFSYGAAIYLGGSTYSTGNGRPFKITFRNLPTNNSSIVIPYAFTYLARYDVDGDGNVLNIVRAKTVTIN